MRVPVRLADGIARLAQRAPGGVRTSAETSFAEIPADTSAVTIPTRHGDLPGLLYSPPGAGGGVHVNLHGGGFVMRHPEQDDALCRYLAATAGVSVLNVDYIPAPQSRFPGQVEQAYDIARWAAEPERPWSGGPVTIGGQSAGGALAAGASRLALENGGPTIALQVLMYPALDLSVPAASKYTPGTEKFLVRMGPVFDAAYCPDESTRGDRLISPAGSADTAPLTGIAPALVITCEKDILREEGARYAERLRRWGSLVDHLDVPGVGHGFNIVGAPREVVVPVYEKIARSIGDAPHR